MASNTDLEEELRTFERRWEQITNVPETPRSLMGVIEYSLDSQRKAEVYVNRLLRYFLDPKEPHGMEAELLKAFLEGLPDQCAFEEDTHDLSNVHVNEQVHVEKKGDENTDGEAVSTGVVDLVLEVPNEWFLMIELKFSAGENNVRGEGASQTEFYYQASHVGGQRKAEYESGNHYLYLHPQDEDRAKEECFTNWTWRTFLNEVLDDFLATNAPRYPQRTVAQLREFIDDIQEITGMTEHHANEREKIELYLEHYEAITDVSKTFDERWNAFSTDWGHRLGNVLETDERDTADRGSFHVKSSTNRLDPEYSSDLWTFLAKSGDSLEEDNEGDDWVFYAKDSDWGHIFKEGWWRPTDDIKSHIVTRDKNRNDVRISFIHRLKHNRDLAIGDRTLKFYFRNCGSNDREFRDQFNQHFADQSDTIDRNLPESATLTGERRNLITATYDIRLDNHDDFFQAYTAALKQAFVDHVVENEALVRTIDRIYEESVEIYQ